MKMNTTINTIDTSALSYDKQRRVFSCEISQLRGFSFSNMGLDMGCTLLNHKSGSSADYVLTHTETDGEDETLYWELTPSEDTQQLHPKTVGTKLILFND